MCSYCVAVSKRLTGDAWKTLSALVHSSTVGVLTQQRAWELDTHAGDVLANADELLAAGLIVKHLADTTAGARGKRHAKRLGELRAIFRSSRFTAPSAERVEDLEWAILVQQAELRNEWLCDENSVYVETGSRERTSAPLHARVPSRDNQGLYRVLYKRYFELNHRAHPDLDDSFAHTRREEKRFGEHHRTWTTRQWCLAVEALAGELGVPAWEPARLAREAEAWKGVPEGATR